jgi:hypothetical protein
MLLRREIASLVGAYATVGSYARPTIISRHITLPKLHPGNILKPQHQEHVDIKGLGKADDYQPDHLWKVGNSRNKMKAW